MLYRAPGGERERTVGRAADSPPGSYFIVLLPLSHPESRLDGNDCESERRDKLWSGVGVGEPTESSLFAFYG